MLTDQNISEYNRAKRLGSFTDIRAELIDGGIEKGHWAYSITAALLSVSTEIRKLTQAVLNLR